MTLLWTDYSFDPSPWIASNLAIDIGEGLGRWLSELAPSEHVHLIGHSAGAWLIDALADELRTRGSVSSIHVTFLDAFAPNLGVGRWGNVAGRPQVPRLGETADYAEQVLDTRELGLASPVGLNTFLGYWTRERLGAVFNIDVTARGEPSVNPIVQHGWPYRWYEQTVLSPRDPATTGGSEATGLFGFGISYEYSGVIPTHDAVGTTHYAAPRSCWIDLSPARAPASCNLAHWNRLDPRRNSNTSSGGGSSSVATDGSIALTTGSPAVLTSTFATTSPISLLRLEPHFLTTTDGILTVELDGHPTFRIARTALLSDAEGGSTGEIRLPQVAPAGTHVLVLRLDPTGLAPASVRIAKIDYGEEWPPSPLDSDGDGVVNFADLVILKRSFFEPPGPSATSP